MDYPSKNDFYLKFKAIYTKEGKFVDYILLSTSKNIHFAIGINSDDIVGKKVSDILTKYDHIFGLKKLYEDIIPGANRKLEFYLESFDRWYFINLFSEERDYFLLVYTDITKIKKQHESSLYKNKDMKKYYRDELTGLYTRDFFNEELERLDTKRMLPLSVIFADVNSLKLVNDAFGHNMGDELLKRVSSIMKNTFRKEEIISRMGGDEFAILLPKTSEETAQEIVDRLKIEYANNPLDYIVLSVSFGIATKEKEDEDIKEILDKADKRMYYMKIKENASIKEYMIDFLKEKLKEVTDESILNYKELLNLSLMMAHALELDENSKEELKLLCEYHDIGKVAIPKDILQKPTDLNSHEWEDIMRHSEIGYHILKGTKKNSSINDLILIHHERWDGKGYPGFLKGEEIPLVVRIFSIVDAYEAMTNDRPYRKRISCNQALMEIKNNAGSQFDPGLVDIFIEVMTKKDLCAI